MTTPVPELHSDSPSTTEAFGAALGAVLRAGDVLALSGPLGAGKTCLARGVVAGAGASAAAVRSPTFVLHQPHRGASLVVHHVDLYRLGPGAALDVLDLDGALVEGAAVIEWAEYADLAGYAPVAMSIDLPGPAREDRVLRLTGPAPAHILSAWVALS